MADETPAGANASFDGDPGHTEESSWASLRGSMGPVFTQAAGLNMDQGIPATAVGTSDPAANEVIAPIHTPGIGGAKANAREDNQSDVF